MKPNIHDSGSKTKGKIVWLSVLQGLCMLLVVVDHIRLCQGQIMPWSAALNDVIESFLMPLFMFISGWLFYYTCIRKEKPYKEVVKSKFIRLGIPFFAFTIMATLVKLPLPFLMHRPVDSEELVKTFLLYRSNPLKELWFVNTLFELMLLYPLYRACMKFRGGPLLAVAVSVLWFIYFPRDIYNFRINYVRWMVVYFTVGIVTARYAIIERINGWLPVVVCGVLFAFFYRNEFVNVRDDLALAFSAIFFLVFLCKKAAEYCPSLFASFRDYTYQIFLMAIFFQMPVRWLFKWLHQDWLYMPLYFTSLLIGLYLPTLIAKLVQKKAPRWVKLCFGL